VGEQVRTRIENIRSELQRGGQQFSASECRLMLHELERVPQLEAALQAYRDDHVDCVRLEGAAEADDTRCDRCRAAEAFLRQEYHDR
jgi:hypothetical protein